MEKKSKMRTTEVWMEINASDSLQQHTSWSANSTEVTHTLTIKPLIPQVPNSPPLRRVPSATLFEDILSAPSSIQSQPTPSTVQPSTINLTPTDFQQFSAQETTQLSTIPTQQTTQVTTILTQPFNQPPTYEQLFHIFAANNFLQSQVPTMGLYSPAIPPGPAIQLQLMESGLQGQETTKNNEPQQ